jgi:hypothetical protein
MTEGTTTRTYEVFGMDCPGCHGGLEKLVEKIPAFRDARANWEKQRLVVWARPDAELDGCVRCDLPGEPHSGPAHSIGYQDGRKDEECCTGLPAGARRHRCIPGFVDAAGIGFDAGLTPPAGSQNQIDENRDETGSLRQDGFKQNAPVDGSRHCRQASLWHDVRRIEFLSGVAGIETTRRGGQSRCFRYEIRRALMATMTVLRDITSAPPAGGSTKPIR